MQYSKPPLSIDEQVTRLTQRGLVCENPERLKHYLTHIGYYRLSAYWLPFEQPPVEPNSRNHNFEAGTTFDRVLDLYDFDRKLRLLVMNAIERIEVAIRTCWANAMAMRHGSHAHMDSELFKDPWQHQRDLAALSREIEKSSEVFIKHYLDQYSKPLLPPIWATVEMMSFGQLSYWFSNTKSTEIKKEVMQSLKLPTIEVLEKVMHTLTPVRNTAAHHGRLWNRQFPMTLPEIKRLRERVVPNNAPNRLGHRIFNYLVIIEYLKSVINPTGQWKSQLMSLLGTVSESDLMAMGFPGDWLEREPWVGVA
ncbi:Abortive infection bacteriophage resistance protein [Malonomonas rubra DSM 5091]|uniref:Abortive infection bacteriophage resistance protein n=1 Tax=Malonomonas rubra DSM 5091 TaxID=1122189 RepID=A0A1M6KWK1_MALRU|nr:Abi family protein [Malonomonas rubra]SHJ63323.1 Abortive infection bacteriophage resistance protein [Malonomonas rubra DSM 5091]